MSRSPWLPPALSAAAGIGAIPVALTLPGLGDVLADDVAWRPSYRVIASEFAGENLYDRFPNAEEFEDYQTIADLTNPHILRETGALHLVPPSDRIYGAGSGLIMAAFTWPARPSRFSDGTRGTYYAAAAKDTAICETRYHDTRMLAGAGPLVVEKTLIEADVSGRVVDVRAGCPAPPGLDHPTDYTAGQSFGRIVRDLDGDGIVYHSVRHRSATGNPLGECVAVFRPPVLRHAVAARSIEYRWDGQRIAAVV
jgi:hypothetical protein